MHRPTRFLTVSSAIAAATLALSSCSSSTDSADADRNASGVLGVEACFTNSLNQKVDLVSNVDGSGVQWESALPAGETACTKSADGFIAMKGTIRVPNENKLFTYRFANRSIGYPTAGIILGESKSSTASGRGVCDSFDESESGVFDTGTTRFTLSRLGDAQGMKQFTVIISPSEGSAVPNSSCSYTIGDSGDSGG